MNVCIKILTFRDLYFFMDFRCNLLSVCLVLIVLHIRYGQWYPQNIFQDPEMNHLRVFVHHYMRIVISPFNLHFTYCQATQRINNIQVAFIGCFLTCLAKTSTGPSQAQSDTSKGVVLTVKMKALSVNPQSSSVQKPHLSSEELPF